MTFSRILGVVEFIRNDFSAQELSQLALSTTGHHTRNRPHFYRVTFNCGFIAKLYFTDIERDKINLYLVM